jgi:hypothetical protein
MSMTRNTLQILVTAIAAISMGAGALTSVSASQATDAFKYPRLVLNGRLSDTFLFDQCEYISGMTCRITLKAGRTLPSQVFFTEFDGAGKQVKRKVRLVYPNLKPGESGRATFRLRSGTPSKIVMYGEWKGAWKSPY